MGKSKQLRMFCALSAALLIAAALIGTARWYLGADDHVIAAPMERASTIIRPAFDPIKNIVMTETETMAIAVLVRQ